MKYKVRKMKGIFKLFLNYNLLSVKIKLSGRVLKWKKLKKIKNMF